MKTVSVILLVLMSAAISDAAELKQESLQAWDDYVRAVDLVSIERAAGNKPFLWVDESPDLGRSVRAGDVLVGGYDLRKVPHGLIHHWIGAIFIPNATLDTVTRVLSDYDRYCDFYRPIVAKSKVLERTDDQERVTLRMVQKAFSVTAAAEIGEDIHITKVGVNRISISSRSTRVQEIANYGWQNEQLLPEGQGPGYVWRMLGITRLEERDGGVYVEMETVVLSRGIPMGFSWLIKPITERLPRDVMFEMLNDTGIAVGQETESTSTKNQVIAQSKSPVNKRVLNSSNVVARSIFYSVSLSQ